MTEAPLHLGANSLYPLPLAGGGHLLIDAGPDLEGGWHDLEAQLAASRIAPSDIRVVLVTHAHADHAGLAARWSEAGAHVLAGRADIEAIRSGETYAAMSAARNEELRRHGAPPAVLEAIAASRLRRNRNALRWDPCPDVEPVEDGAAFALAGHMSLRVIEAPGHTPGNLVALVEGHTDSAAGPQPGDLYSGDTLLPVTIPSPGLHFPAGPEGERWPSLPPFLASVRRLAGLPLRRVLPGHGPAVGTPEALIARFEGHHARRASQIRALLGDLPDTAYGISRRLFRRLPDDRLGQAMTEVIGHLDVLLAAGEAHLESSGDGTVVARLREGDRA